MFDYPSMPPSKISTSTAHIQPINASQTPHLLLFSFASATAAVSITVGRLLLSETGTVLLLLSNGSSYDVNEDGMLDGVDYDFAGECLQNNIAATVGKYLIATAASPYVRSAPLILIVFSSAAFVMGVILIRNELNLYASKLEPIVGGDWNEFMCKVKSNFCSGKKNLEEQIERGIECIDSVVADDVIKRIVRAGNEIVSCAAGGYALYSLPDQMLPGLTTSNKADNGEASEMQNMRRKVVYAMDPSLDDMLFKPGGFWRVAPGLREYLVGLTRRSKANKPAITFVDAPTVDSTANGSDSHGIGEDEKSNSHGSLPTLIHVRQHLQAGVESPPEEGSIIGKHENAENTPQANNNKNSRKQQQQPTPPPIPLGTILHRTALTATFFFFLHLHKSPSTRKTWKSAMHFFASCGLLSTAVGTGVASLLSSSMNSDNSLPGTACLLLPNAKVHDLLNKLKETIKSNRRLQMVLAFTVLYGLKRSQSSLRGRVGRRR